MYQENRLLTIYVEESLHAGTGRGLGAVDLPVQRERTTDFPMLQASGIKGKLRAECDPSTDPAQTAPLAQDVFNALYGDLGHQYAGALSVGDAAILLFPVRSLNGVYAWTTCPEVLARFERTLARLGWPTTLFDPIRADLAALTDDEALIGSTSRLKITTAGSPPASSVALEENSFMAKSSTNVDKLAGSLGPLLPAGTEYTYFKDQLAKRLCILPDNAFHDFVRYATEVQTHVSLDRDTKTATGKFLWTSESLPPDTLLYTPLLSTPPRTDVSSLAETDRTAAGLLASFHRYFDARLARLQLGGDETTGQGFVALNLLKKGDLP